MNVSDIKQNNQNKVYVYLREKGFATKQEIAQNLHLSLPTVSKNLEFLLANNLISSEKKTDSVVEGRKPIQYIYAPQAKLAIGIDITQHQIKAVLVDLKGTIIRSTIIKKTFSQTEEYLLLFNGIVQELSVELPSKDIILGVGISVPGLINAAGTKVVYGRIIQNEGMDIERFKKHIPYPCRFIHDSIAGGFAEIWCSPDIVTAYYLSLSNSLGSMVILNRQLYMGNPLYSSEIGHLKIVPDGAQCYCGQLGCADAYCKGDILAAKAGGSISAFFEQLKTGDKVLEKVWDTYLDYLTMIVCNVRMMFGCSIILGGYIGAYFQDDYIDELRRRVDQKNAFFEHSSKYLFPCKLKTQAIAVGSALFYINEFLEPLCQTSSDSWSVTM